MSHPHCTEGHICQQPSGRTCLVVDCDEPAGTAWGPLWCPVHDQERLDRITRQLEAIVFDDGVDTSCGRLPAEGGNLP